MLPDESDEKSGPTEGETAAPKNGEEAAAPVAAPPESPPPDGTQPLFALGEAEQAPLAAVFKRRRGGGGGGRRPSRAEREAEAPPSRAPDGPEAGSYDIVLTDAFRVADDPTAPPLVGPSAPPQPGPPPVLAADATPVVASAPPPVPVAAEGGPPPIPPPPRPSPPPPPPPRAEARATEPEESIEIPDDTEPAGRLASTEAAVELDPAMALDYVLSLARKSATTRRTPAAGAWFSELFGSDYFLAHPQRNGTATLKEVEYIEGALRLEAGARVLDVCCGYGRHTVPLAAHGFEVVGLDLSLDMLKAALGRAQSESLAIKFVHGDMRDLNFREVFDGVFSFDSSFGFFSESENLMVLRGVFEALKKGGRFLLDVANRDYAIRGIPTRNWWEGDGCLVQEDIEFDHATSRLSIKRFAVFADGMQREYNISMRLYSLHELIRMFQMVGFELREVSGSRHTPGSFFGPASSRIILVGEKPAPRS